MSTKLRHIAMFSGNTILGDGSVIMIIDPNGIAQAIGTVDRRDRRRGDAEARAERRDRRRPCRCWCSAPARPSRRRCRCRWSRGSRRSTARRSSSRTAATWCSTAASSCRWCGSTTRSASRTEGAQPLLVFSDDGRSMGLVVDEIVDIVEERLDIEVASERARRARLGRGQGPGDRDHRCRPFPAARLRGLVPPQGDDAARRSTRTLLFVDDSAFFRNMLTPVLKAAGYDVTAVGGGRRGAGAAQEGRAVRRHRHPTSRCPA